LIESSALFPDAIPVQGIRPVLSGKNQARGKSGYMQFVDIKKAGRKLLLCLQTDQENESKNAIKTRRITRCHMLRMSLVR
jgi:hypothetical protein